jgi:FlaA1/EpsC-like NDP-sugar epimerase
MLQKINILPRWIIFFLDLSITTLAFFVVNLFNYSFSLSAIDFVLILKNSAILLLVNSAVFYLFKTYSGIIRYTGSQDALRLFKASFISFLSIEILNLLSGLWETIAFPLSLWLTLTYSLTSFAFLISYRLAIKWVFSYSRNYKLDLKKVLIYGAGEAGFATRRVLAHDAKANVQIVAFLDDNPKKINKVVDGIAIHAGTELTRLCKEQEIDELIIATFNLPIKKKNDIIDTCLELGIKVMNVPPLSKWINGEFSTRQLQGIKIDQLLEREPIHINNQLIEQQIKNKRILVTGAAGSIGSEIVRQLIKFKPESIILCDQAETPLHDLELELQEITSEVNCIPYLADIRNTNRMEELFNNFRPQYVYHAAAYKHVPMMERSPAEAIQTNVSGTQVVADLAIKNRVERFVMVSTDKAVNPTNVMGASKRLAEMYIQSLHATTKATKFITTRFGNVLGSNGSVLHRFKEQIEKGGPLTVTHPEITRYFMTIPEACQLVLEAGSMGKGGEIFVFDMGESIKIVDLAKKMIRLYGLVPNQDIEIAYTGLRPGEKLYEELLNDAENTLPTYHHKITIAKVRPLENESLSTHFTELLNLASNPEKLMDLVAKMKELVPEFVSNNSVFEELDEETNQAKIIDFKRVS